MRRTTFMLIFAVGCAAPQARTTVERGAEPEPAAEMDHLGRAAELLDSGDSAGALAQLTAHVKARPDAVMIRAYLAELHFKQGQPDKAKTHFTRFTRDAAGMGAAAGKHLTHCHTRLMEIATANDDAFGEQLHRGIGLVLLVRQWDAEPDAEDAGLTETTLVRAAAALKIARELDAKDPRVHLYLSEAFGRLGQHSAARSALNAAKELLPDPTLNADELRRIRAAE
jgi:Tfp pilus assembly protein PilF